MKQDPSNTENEDNSLDAMMEQLSPNQQKLFRSLLDPKGESDWVQIEKRKLRFSARDILRVAAEVNNEALETRLEMEELSSKERLLFLPMTVNAVVDELENLKIEALVNDDDLAFESLHKIANESARQLLLVTRVKIEKAAKIAEKLEAWPIPFANDLVTKKASEELVKRLRLGTKRVATTDPSNVYSESTEARKWVGLFVGLIESLREKSEMGKKAYANLYGQDVVDEDENDVINAFLPMITSLEATVNFQAILEEENPFLDKAKAKEFILAAIALPPLTPDKVVVKAWANTIRDVVTKMHDGFPEKNRKLRGLGQYLAKGNEDVAPKNTASYESNLRSGIFQRFERTLTSIAKG